LALDDVTVEDARTTEELAVEDARTTEELAMLDARTTEEPTMVDERAGLTLDTVAVGRTLDAEMRTVVDARAPVLELEAVGRALDTTPTTVELTGVTETGLWMAAPRDGATAVKTATAETKIAVLIWTIFASRGV
jgi:hypothetical protein